MKKFILIGLLSMMTFPVMGQTLSAEYSITFTSFWSAETHPTDFPGNPHFSGLIGAVHHEGVVFWEPGAPASDGMRTMAETGGKSPLDDEVNEAIAAGTALSVISGGGIGTSPGEVEVSPVTVTRDYPLVTLVSMIAPSPDWFVGVHGLSLLEDGDWVEELVVQLAGWDAGTDSGSSYTSGNAPTVPREPIALLQGAPLEADGEIAPLGVFTFQRMDMPSGAEHWSLYP